MSDIYQPIVSDLDDNNPPDEDSQAIDYHNNLVQRLRGNYVTGIPGDIEVRRDFSPYLPPICNEAADRISELEIINGEQTHIINNLRGQLINKVCNMCNFLERSICYENTKNLEDKITKLKGNIKEIKGAINGYYEDLNAREHGALAQHKAFTKIENILGMCWDDFKQ